MAFSWFVGTNYKRKTFGLSSGFLFHSHFNVFDSFLHFFSHLYSPGFGVLNLVKNDCCLFIPLFREVISYTPGIRSMPIGKYEAYQGEYSFWSCTFVHPSVRQHLCQSSVFKVFRSFYYENTLAC